MVANNEICNEDKVVLVDANDKVLGVAGKLDAHLLGKLHRAFSVFVFNSSGKLLLQKRHTGKYHSGGLWTNTCCSHPRPGESTAAAVHRRLGEEMGFDCGINRAFSFVYRAEFANKLIEHEYDHVYVGQYNSSPVPCPMEVEGWQWVNLRDLLISLERNADLYTYWFKLAVCKLADKLRSMNLPQIEALNRLYPKSEGVY